MTDGNAPARTERSSEEKKQRFWGRPVPSGSPGADDADANRRAAGAVCSSLATAAEPIPLPGDGAARSPDVVWLSRSRPIGTVRAADTGGNYECSPHRPRAGCHRLLGGVHAGRGRCLPDIGGSHRAGRGKSAPVKRPAFQDVAVAGGAYPEAGVVAADEAGGVGSCSFCGERAGANSLVRSASGASLCPSSSLRFHVHWATICQASCPQDEWLHQRSGSSSMSSSSRAVSKAPRCR